MKKYLYRSRFYFVLHTMVSNGVTILGALRAPFETTAYQEAAYRLQEDIADGSTLADAMAKISLFPPFEVDTQWTPGPPDGCTGRPDTRGRRSSVRSRPSGMSSSGAWGHKLLSREDQIRCCR